MSFGASKLFQPKNNKVEEYVYSSRMNSSVSEEKTISVDKVEEQHSEIPEMESVVNEKYEASTEEEEVITTNDSVNEEVNESTMVSSNVVYNGMTLESVSAQLNRSLNSTLKGQGELIASYSLSKNVDPYLATAIMLHETGCSWNCSTLVTSCNNVGGMKGSPSCGNSSYKAFATLEDGIKGFIDNLATNYYSYGLTTPELMNSRYAESTVWASKVNTYINQIKSN